jgi:hypothetical protein
MKKLPCKLCLKFPICVSKPSILCKDLIQWLIPAKENFEHTPEFVRRLGWFESFYDREVSVITEKTICLYFKKEKDHHSCLVAKNM